MISVGHPTHDGIFPPKIHEQDEQSKIKFLGLCALVVSDQRLDLKLGVKKGRNPSECCRKGYCYTMIVKFAASVLKKLARRDF